MPVSAAICIRDRAPYCEYAMDPHVAFGRTRERRNSVATNATGNTSVDPTPPRANEPLARSIANGTMSVKPSTTTIRRYATPDAGMDPRSAIPTIATEAIHTVTIAVDAGKN